LREELILVSKNLNASPPFMGKLVNRTIGFCNICLQRVPNCSYPGCTPLC